MTKPKLSPEATAELQAVLDRAARRMLREQMAAAADEDANLDPDERCPSKSVGPNGAQCQCVLTARHEGDHRHLEVAFFEDDDDRFLVDRERFVTHYEIAGP